MVNSLQFHTGVKAEYTCIYVFCVHVSLEFDISVCAFSLKLAAESAPFSALPPHFHVWHTKQVNRVGSRSMFLRVLWKQLSTHPETRTHCQRI